MRALLAVLIVASASAPATARAQTLEAAFPPTVRIAGPVAAVSIAVHSAPAVTWLAIDVPPGRRSAHGGSASPRELAIDLPTDSAVVGVIANGTLATPMRWQAAVANAHAGVDPTLTRWLGASAGEQHVAIELRDDGRVELAVVLPPYARLRIDVGTAKLAATIDDAPVAHPSVLDLHALPAPPDLGDTPVLDDATWFVADDPLHPSRAALTVSVGRADVAWHDGFHSKGDIRRTVHWHMNQLRYCYESQLLAQPRLAGTATLTFRIVGDGSVAQARAEGDLPDVVTDCLAAEAATWTFPETDETTEVHYPLTFKRAPE